MKNAQKFMRLTLIITYYGNFTKNTSIPIFLSIVYETVYTNSKLKHTALLNDSSIYYLRNITVRKCKQIGNKENLFVTKRPCVL